MEKNSISLTRREMQIKTILIFHFVPVSMALKNKQGTTNSDKDVDKGTPTSAHERYTIVQPLQNSI